MYASEPFFNFEPRHPVVPSWFKGLVVPFLLLLALPLSLAGAGTDAGPVRGPLAVAPVRQPPAPVRPQPHRAADGAQILTDVDYVVLDDEKR